MPARKKAAGHILVVDDEPLVCDSIKMLLGYEGYTVDSAGSAREALEIFDSGKFDVLITDFAMPGMQGDALAAAIKDRSPNTPVIMITAYAEMLESDGRPLQGVDCLVSKPFMLDDLRNALAQVMANRLCKPKHG